MKWYLLATAAVLSLTLTACGGTKQDPFADESEPVKNGQVPGKPAPPDEKPLSQDVLRIYSAEGGDYFVFREGVEQEIEIRATSSFNDVQYAVEISNLDQFKNATSETTEGDSSKGTGATATFKWAPPKGQVIADVITYQLEAKVYTMNFTHEYVYIKKFQVFIYKENFAIPEIVSISPVAGAVKEGKTSSFTVTVKDIDATPSTQPDLLAMTSYADKNGAPYVSWNAPVQDAVNPTLWRFTVSVNLVDVEITNGQNKAELAIAAVSAAGKKSQAQKVSYNVWTSIMAPSTSWIEPVAFKIGQKNRFDFTILDPKGEGELKANFITPCAALPGAPQCTCANKVGVTGKANTLAACTIEWNVPADIPFQEQQILYTGENKSTLPGDVDVKTVPFNGKITLVP